MLINYLKIAWRNLKRNKSFTFINIAGLAVALAVFIIISMFVRHEYSYDQFFSKADQIYRVVLVNKQSTVGDGTKIQVPEPISDDLKQLYPEVTSSVRVTGPIELPLAANKRNITSKEVALVGAAFFEIFDFPFIQGNASTAFEKPQGVVITRKMALKLFDSVDVMGKQIKLKALHKSYTITGIIKNIPSNTHFNISVFAARGSMYKGMSKWNTFTNETYLKLNKPHKAAQLQEKLPGYVRSHNPAAKKGELGHPPKLILQPLTDIHLHPRNKAGNNSQTFYIQVLLIVAGLILLVACINYMNISTAQSIRRAREIGVRKTLGAMRWQIIGQVMMESIITCFSAFIIALALVNLLKPLATQYLSISMGSLYQFSGGWIFFLVGLLLTVSLLSGSYAAFYLSSFQPKEVLRGAGLQSGTKAAGFRKLLVVAQFAISIAIIIFSLLISKQMDFVRTKQLNSHSDHIMMVKNTDRNFPDHFSSFKEKLEKKSAVYSVSAGTVPTQVGRTSSYSNSDSTNTSMTINNFTVKYDYLKTMGLKLLSGRTFDPKRSLDSTDAVLLTKSFAASKGYEEANGQQITKPNGKLIGIVEDFHSQTLFDQDKPVTISIMQNKYSFLSTILVRLKQGHISTGIDQVRKVWSDFEPDYPLNYNFLDKVFDQKYQAELQLNKIFNLFSVFAIFIACLGLFGLAAFAAERRTQEIGIRKVVGASVTNIVGLLSKDFLKLVLLGFVIAVPLGKYATNYWLQNFAYKTNLSFWIYLLAGGLALIIALVTVSWQSIRAALANPVDSLRSE